MENRNKTIVRECQPSWRGVKYIPATGKHLHADTITDDMAVDLLAKNMLSEADFLKLPKNLAIKRGLNVSTYVKSFERIKNSFYKLKSKTWK